MLCGITADPKKKREESEKNKKFKEILIRYQSNSSQCAGNLFILM